MNAYQVLRLCTLTRTPARCRRAANLLARFGRRSGNPAMVELSNAMVELAHVQECSRIGDYGSARSHAEKHRYLCWLALRIVAGDSSRETR